MQRFQANAGMRPAAVSRFGTRAAFKGRGPAFQRVARQAVLRLEGRDFAIPAAPAFWSRCRQVESRHVRDWLWHQGLDIWPVDFPARVRVTDCGTQHYEVTPL